MSTLKKNLLKYAQSLDVPLIRLIAIMINLSPKLLRGLFMISLFLSPYNSLIDND